MSDISLDSMMLCREDDKVYGVLNDMDLAVSIGVTIASLKQHTGSKPFMAINLLWPDPPVHMYCHDLESMFYVLVWITSRFNNGKELIEPPLQEWVDLGGMALIKEKNLFIMSVLLPPTSEFDALGRWVVSLQTMIRDGFSVRTKYRSELTIAN